MRFKSSLQYGYQIYAVNGVNTISFAIDFEKADTKDLLGFAVERDDPKDQELARINPVPHTEKS